MNALVLFVYHSTTDNLISTSNIYTEDASEKHLNLILHHIQKPNNHSELRQIIIIRNDQIIKTIFVDPLPILSSTHPASEYYKVRSSKKTKKIHRLHRRKKENGKTLS